MSVTLAVLGAAAFAWFAFVRADGCSFHVDLDYVSNDALERCAAGGDPDAQMFLGIVYWIASEGSDPESFGLEPGLSREEMLAAGWRLMRAAAEAGDVVAQNEVGLAYLEGGYGAPVDFAEAHFWFQRAAASGERVASYNLSRMYASGFGVEANLKTALAHLESSAQGRYPDAKCLVAKWRKLESQLATSERLTAFAQLVNNARSRLCAPRTPDPPPVYPIRNLTAALGDSVSTVSEWMNLALARTPDEASCSVYRKVTEQLFSGTYAFLRPTTRFDTFWLGFSGDESPWTFLRDTGETETVEYDGELYERRIVEPFDFDVSMLLPMITSGQAENLKPCFGDEGSGPSFWLSSLEALRARERTTDTEGSPSPTIWSLSRGGISPDGASALIYVEYYCGGLCAAGDLFLFTQDEAGSWAIAGRRNLWVS